MSGRPIRRIGADALVTAILATGITLTGAVTPAAASVGNGITVGVPNLAVANVGQTACSTNTLGANGFGTSCTGDHGQAEPWSADFLAWDWGQEGVVTTVLLNSAGAATPNSVVKYGLQNATLHADADYAPRVGDAIVYDNPVDYVAMVTAVNADGSIQAVGGDWGNSGPGTSTVTTFAIPASQVPVGTSSPALNNKVVADYVSPAPVPGASTSLIPFGAINWTPPGSTQSRVDIFAADPHGVLWDYRHTVGAPDSQLGTPTQAESGWTHYREVGVADMDHNGYPDIVAIDASDSQLVIFTGSATGFATTARAFDGGGWSTNFTPFGIVDWNHTGQLGVLARQNDISTMFLYPGDLTGGVGPRVQTGTGWTSVYSPVGMADVNADGHTDLLVCRTDLGDVQLYSGDGGTGTQSPYGGWVGSCAGRTFFGLVDYDGDGRPDLITRDDATGVVSITPDSLGQIGTVIAPGSAATRALVPFGATTWTPPGATAAQTDIYAADGNGNLLVYTQTPNSALSANPKTVETGWTHYRQVGVADFNHDGYPDVVTIDTNTGVVEIFTGTATGLATTPVAFGSGWSGNLIPFGIVDWDHTGTLGILARQNDISTMFFYPGDLTTGISPRVQTGTGWASNFNPAGLATGFATPGHADLFTCRTDTGGISLYTGDNTGGGSPITDVLNGCAGDTFFGLTDYTGDGHPDLIARDNTTGTIVLAEGDGTGSWPENTSTTITTTW